MRETGQCAAWHQGFADSRTAASPAVRKRSGTAAARASAGEATTSRPAIVKGRTCPTIALPRRNPRRETAASPDAVT